MIDASSCSCSQGSAAAVAELQATTSSFTSRASRCEAICQAKLLISSMDLGP